MQNKALFQQSEFQRWTDLHEVEPAERYVLSTYLKPAGRTLEAGCGGGRLTFALQTMGFQTLAGFDFVPEFIDIARSHDPTASIDFRVLDARTLDYPDHSFDQVVYLQQLLSVIDDEEGRRKAVQEAFRVLRPGGIIVANALGFRARLESRALRPLICYLAVFRWLTRQNRSLQYQPWLRLHNAPNLGVLWDRGPYIYWFKDEEFVALLESAGFQPFAVGTDAQVASGQFAAAMVDLRREPLKGRIYAVCLKPQ